MRISSPRRTAGRNLVSWENAFALAIGLWLGLSLVKFGNPIILNHLVTDDTLLSRFSQVSPDQNPQSNTASGWVDQLTAPWPFHRGVWMVFFLALAAIKVGRLGTRPPIWLLSTILIWFCWQCIAAADSVDRSLSRITLLHFGTCMVGFFIGYFALSRCRNPGLAWAGLSGGMLIVFWVAFQQHYGGLDAIRQMVYEESPNWAQLPPEYLKRLSSGRVFATLVYPNALAGVILLLLPPCLSFLWGAAAKTHRILRGVIVGSFAYSGCACLVWSGSKAGWIIALILACVVLFQLPLSRNAKSIFICLLIGLGLLSFGYRYFGYFQRGATSASARIDYWSSALRISLANPLTGTGPGTFSKSYQAVKSPDSEMARLTHNDYLQQACDSGFPGFFSYLAFVSMGIIPLYGKRKQMDRHLLCVGLGILGWLLHSLVEFGLYIPAISWPAFVSFGWLNGKLSNMNNDIVVEKVK